jgi:RNA polymerase sigma-70 factor, ECF subfamily
MDHGTQHLIERIREGDSQAFSSLFSRCGPRLAVLIHHSLGPQLQSTLTVDDVLQETWLRAFQQMDQFSPNGPGSFMRWLGTIARHVIVDEARKVNRQKRQGRAVRFRSDSNPNGPDPAVSLTPSRMLFRKEAVRVLLERLDALPPQYREVIVLARIEERSTREIAEHLGRSRESAAVLLHRALRRFREVAATDSPRAQLSP